MKQIITAKVKLHPTPSQFAAFRKTQLAYRDALNYVSQYSFTHGKMSTQRALQRECYGEIRLKFGLPAQMACNVHIDLVPRMTARAVAAELLASSMRLLPEAILLTETRAGMQRAIFVNEAFLQLSGHSMAEILERDLSFLRGPKADPSSFIRFLQSPKTEVSNSFTKPLLPGVLVTRIEELLQEAA